MTTTINRMPRVQGKIGIHQPGIEGRFRRITAHQITMAWWLHLSGNITRRQLRVYFAAHEMHERRKYANPQHRDTDNRRRNPSASRTHTLYRVEEIAAMVGGKGSTRALAGLRADIRHLAKLGLVTIEAHSITFAVSIDEIRTDDISGFWTMFEQIPNSRRTVPVPRRSLRALAGVGGFSRGVSGVMLAMLIRSLFWHKESASYRVDGRTKASWIVEVFGLSRRAVTDARATLIELGWIEDLEPPQWAMNRWGSHDRINPDWAPTTSSTKAQQIPQPTNHFNRVSTPAAVGGSDWNSNRQTALSTYTGFASPQAKNDSGSASPCLNKYSLPTGDLNTRRLEGKPPNPPSQSRSKTGVSARNGFQETPNQTAPPRFNPNPKQDKPGSGKKNLLRKPSRRSALPNIRDIQLGHMQETSDLLELYRQAIAIELAKPSEAGRLDFLALAERAKSHGKRAGALFFWLLREKKTVFITQGEEDAAVTRIRALHNPDNRRSSQPEQGGGGEEKRQGGTQRLKSVEWSKEDRFVQACIRVAAKMRIEDPFRIAFKQNWKRDRWEKAFAHYEAKQWEQLQRSKMIDED